MYRCPYCKSENVDAGSQCQSCGADLALLLRLDVQADVWFNAALDALAADDVMGAAELLSACCVLRPEDVEARVVLTQVLARSGRWEEAVRAAAIASSLQADWPGLQALKAAVETKLDRSLQTRRPTSIRRLHRLSAMRHRATDRRRRRREPDSD